MLPFAPTAAVRQMQQNMPGDTGIIPFFGRSFDFLYDPIGAMLAMRDQYGDVFWTQSLGIYGVFMISPEANQLVLRNEDNAFSNHLGWDFFIGKFFKRGIMLLDFEEHRFHRGIMQAAFKKNALVRYLEGMNPAIRQGIARWQPGPDFKVLVQLKKLTLDIATEIFMGEKLGPEADRVTRAFIDCVLAGTALVRYPVPGGRWYRGLKARAVLEEFFRSRVAAKRANPGDDLFSRLCLAEDENGQKFTDDDVVNHMIFVMMAAHDTSTITLTAMFYYLAKHPEWQEKIRAESLALGKEFIEHEDLPKLNAADMVMKESMRLLAPVHGIPRKTVKEVKFKGYTIPADTYVIISPIVTHHLADWWKDPEKFDPERFSKERNEHKKHMYQYLPFGGGAHMCIGLHFAEMQVKAILHQVVLKYRWSVPKGYTMPINFTSLPTPRDKLPVRLERI